MRIFECAHPERTWLSGPAWHSYGVERVTFKTVYHYNDLILIVYTGIENYAIWNACYVSSCIWRSNSKTTINSPTGEI